MESSAGSSTIRVTRTTRTFDYRDRLRAYKVNVDGAKVGVVRRHGVVEAVVEPGRHVVRVTVDWSGSPEVDVVVAAGETVTLSATPHSAFRSIPNMFRDVFSTSGWVDLTVDGPDPT